MCLNVFRQSVNGVCCIQKDDSISCLALRLGANGGWRGERGGVVWQRAVLQPEVSNANVALIKSHPAVKK